MMYQKKNNLSRRTIHDKFYFRVQVYAWFFFLWLWWVKLLLMCVKNDYYFLKSLIVMVWNILNHYCYYVEKLRLRGTGWCMEGNELVRCERINNEFSTIYAIVKLDIFVLVIFPLQDLLIISTFMFNFFKNSFWTSPRSLIRIIFLLCTQILKC